MRENDKRRLTSTNSFGSIGVNLRLSAANPFPQPRGPARLSYTRTKRLFGNPAHLFISFSIGGLNGLTRWIIYAIAVSLLTPSLSAQRQALFAAGATVNGAPAVAASITVTVGGVAPQVLAPRAAGLYQVTVSTAIERLDWCCTRAGFGGRRPHSGWSEHCRPTISSAA
jgi:hypothetical protein